MNDEVIISMLHCMLMLLFYVMNVQNQDKDCLRMNEWWINHIDASLYVNVVILGDECTKSGQRLSENEWMVN